MVGGEEFDFVEGGELADWSSRLVTLPRVRELGQEMNRCFNEFRNRIGCRGIQCLGLR